MRAGRVFFVGTLCLTAVLLCLQSQAAEQAATSPDESEEEVNQPRRTTIDRQALLLGRYVYQRNCQLCHGKRGDGKGDWSASLEPKPRSFRLAHFKYRSTPFGTLPTDDDLRRTIRGGRSNTAMGMFKKLSDREVEAVIAYIKTFSRKWRDSTLIGAPVELPQRPSWYSTAALREQAVARGRETFEVACLPCHGENADGKGPQALSLLDELGRPIRPANLSQPHLRNGETEEDFLRVLMTGLNGTPMLSFADSLTGEQLWEVVAYLMKLRAK